MSESILYDIIQEQNTVIYDLKSSIVVDKSVSARSKTDDLKLKMSELIDEYLYEENNKIKQDYFVNQKIAILEDTIKAKDIEIQKQKDIIDKLNEKYNRMVHNNRLNINEINKALDIIKNIPLTDKNSTKAHEEKKSTILDEEEMVENYHIKMTKMEREFRKQAEAKIFKTFQ